MPKSGRVPQVGTGGSRAIGLQGSGWVVRVPTGGAGHEGEHESGDGLFPVSVTCRKPANGCSAGGFWKEVTAATRDLLWRAGLVWRRSGGGQDAFA
jgi:hypothetical protein